MSASTSTRLIGKLALALVSTAVVALLIAWLAGAFHQKVPAAEPGTAQAEPRLLGDRAVADVRSEARPRVVGSVGTIRAVHETSVASKILANVEELLVNSGQAVKAGDVVARLDSVALRARVRQAEAGLEAARAALEKAQNDERRSRSLFEQGIAPRQELDDALSAMRTATAAVERAQHGLDEVQASLADATVLAPMDGVVIDRAVEPGDTVTPGRILFTLYDPTRMQLVASVRESLAANLEVGETVAVRIDALDLDCHGTIAEIVPRAAERTRTFDVKVTGPCPPGVYSGMFGRLYVPIGEEQVLLAPAAALSRVGQLMLADVVEDGVLRRRAVQTGRRFGPDVEILSGLSAGERIALPAGN